MLSVLLLVNDSELDELDDARGSIGCDAKRDLTQERVVMTGREGKGKWESISRKRKKEM
jgi:hypothetical protein